LAVNVAIAFSIYILSNVRAENLKAKKEEKPSDMIDDKELDALLKDPKYASMAGDLLKPGGKDLGVVGSASLGGADLGSLGAGLGGTDKDLASLSSSSLGGSTDLLKDDQKPSHYMSPSYKAHLDRMKKGGESTEKKKDDPLANLDSLLASDPLKELGLLDSSTKKKDTHLYSNNGKKRRRKLKQKTNSKKF